jgi:hypothetical protein
VEYLKPSYNCPHLLDVQQENITNITKVFWMISKRNEAQNKNQKFIMESSKKQFLKIYSFLDQENIFSGFSRQWAGRIPHHH